MKSTPSRNGRNWPQRILLLATCTTGTTGPFDFPRRDETGRRGEEDEEDEDQLEERSWFEHGETARARAVALS